MKRFLLVAILLCMTMTVMAQPPEPFNSPLPGWPPVPPVDLTGVNEWMAMGGLSAVGLAVIEVLKRLGVIPDGAASRWASIFNIVGFAVLTIVGVFGVDVVNNTDIQNVFDMLVRVCQAVLVVLGSPLLFKLVRRMGILPPLKDR